MTYPNETTKNEKKNHSEETQTLRAGMFGGAKNFRPDAQDGQNLTSWSWSLPSPTDPVWQFRVIVVTDPQTNTQTDRTDYNTPLHC